MLCFAGAWRRYSQKWHFQVEMSQVMRRRDRNHAIERRQAGTVVLILGTEGEHAVSAAGSRA